MGQSAAAVSSSQGIYSLVGAYAHRDNAAYLHLTNGNSTTQLNKISSPGGNQDYFATNRHSVDMVSGSDGLYILIGASGGDTRNGNSGEAFLLRTTDNGANITHWNGVATSSLAPNVLTASSMGGHPASDSNDFGKSVAVVSSSEGVFSLIGDPMYEGAETDDGAAYLFRTHAGTTSQVQILAAADLGEEGGKFGHSVSMTSGSDGLYGLIGMPDEKHAFLYKFHGNNYQNNTLLHVMTSSTNADYHGASTSIVSSPHGIYSLVGSETNTGEEAILYKTLNGTTSQVCILTGSNSGNTTMFGQDLSVTADSENVYCLITDTLAGSETLGGRAYLYAVHKDTQTPQQVATYETADPDDSPNAGALFGYSAALVLDDSRNNLYSFIGAIEEDDPESNSGALHIHKHLLTTSTTPAFFMQPPLQSRNCLWWNQRAEKSHTVISSSIATDRQDLFISIRDAKLEDLNKGAFFTAENLKSLNEGAKRIDYTKSETKFGTGAYLSIEATGISLEKDCDDVLNPNEKMKYDFKVEKA